MSVKLVRSAASFIPSSSLLTARRLKDLPRRVLRRPHDNDFLPFSRFSMNNPVVVDVGANRGQSVDSFCNVLHDPKIYAVEPNPFLAASLQRRYASINVMSFGLGEAAGSFTLYIPRYGYTHWDTRASLDRNVAVSFLSQQFFAFFDARRAAIVDSHVRIRTLDELHLAPDILKLDAEGHEMQILKGGLETIQRHEPVIFCETPSDQVAQLLGAFGYDAYAASGCTLRKGEGERNTFFLMRVHLDNFSVEL